MKLGETGDETKKVWLVYQPESGTAEFKTPSEISKLVKAGKTYDVNVANDKADDTGDITADELDDVKTAAYWKNGFIKVITIKENGASSASGSKTTDGD